jgi:hypothetical protein
MARKKLTPEELEAFKAQQAAWAVEREEMARLIDRARAQLAARKAAEAEWEARRARRAARLHRILTLGLGRAA